MVDYQIFDKISTNKSLALINRLINFVSERDNKGKWTKIK